MPQESMSSLQLDQKNLYFLPHSSESDTLKITKTPLNRTSKYAVYLVEWKVSALHFPWSSNAKTDFKELVNKYKSVHCRLKMPFQ